MGNESSTTEKQDQQKASPIYSNIHSTLPLSLEEEDYDTLDDASSAIIVNHKTPLPTLPEVSSSAELELQEYTDGEDKHHLTLTPTGEEVAVVQTNPIRSSTSETVIIMPTVDLEMDYEGGDCDHQEDTNPTASAAALSHTVLMQPLTPIPSLKHSNHQQRQEQNHLSDKGGIKNHPPTQQQETNDFLRSRKGSKSDPDLLMAQHILMMNQPTSNKSTQRNTSTCKKKNNNIPFLTISTMDGAISSSSIMITKESRVRKCCNYTAHLYRDVIKNTIVCMNILAKIVFWMSLVSMLLGIVWYSKELHEHGTDPHLIAWFSAGAFVILGFPISMYGIIMHLSNYFQPNIQCYVVRILWIVPFYSIESWLSLRFHLYALYIQTLRDCYESYVLYCFLQYLIEVLGGEEALINLLKDKSPTRGVHFPPLNWCMKPWIMGQPVSNKSATISSSSFGAAAGVSNDWLDHGPTTSSRHSSSSYNKYSRVQWTSPFFVQCKFGVLQYVLLKFISALFVVVLEKLGWYKEGDFTHKGGYLYICILTNTSQCWALYCLVFFYYATKNQLSPIRPVGKFLSVKALVFFTWWQSVGISILFYFGLIKPYKNGEWSAEAVAKGIQDYMICVELFFFAIAHLFVFPHTDYLQPLTLDSRSISGTYMEHRKRLGRKWKYTQSLNLHPYGRTDDKSTQSKNSSLDGDLDMTGMENDDKYFDKHRLSQVNEGCGDVELAVDEPRRAARADLSPKRTGFVRALLDSAVPRDVMDNTVGLARGDYNVEKKSLLSHATASDEYNLFAKTKFRRSNVR